MPINKKINWLLVAVAVNSAAIVFLLYFTANIDQRIESLSAGYQSPPATNKVAKNARGGTQAKIKNIDILITDKGYNKPGISALSGEKINIKITNSGSKSYSFKIDELKFDSGTIEPGQTMNLSLDNLPQEPKNYRYYSGPNQENADFSGILMIY